jgi:hypothetical protein
LIVVKQNDVLFSNVYLGSYRSLCESDWPWQGRKATATHLRSFTEKGTPESLEIRANDLRFEIQVLSEEKWRQNPLHHHSLFALPDQVAAEKLERKEPSMVESGELVHAPESTEQSTEAEIRKEESEKPKEMEICVIECS